MRIRIPKHVIANKTWEKFVNQIIGVEYPVIDFGQCQSITYEAMYYFVEAISKHKKSCMILSMNDNIKTLYKEISRELGFITIA